MPDWIIVVVRLLVLVSLITGGYRGLQRMRQEGPGPAIANAINTLTLLIFMVTAVMLIVFYFAFFWPRYAIAAAAGIVVFIVGGYALLGRLFLAVQRRFGGASQPHRLC